MSRTLRHDVYSLGAPGFSIDQVKQPDPDPLGVAQHSCLYWIDHLFDCDTTANTDNDLKDGDSVDEVLCQSYLYWLEELSLIGCMSSGVVMIRKLENRLKVNFSTLPCNIILLSPCLCPGAEYCSETIRKAYPKLYSSEIQSASRFERCSTDARGSLVLGLLGGLA